MIDRTIQRLAASERIQRIYAPAVLIASKPVKDIDNDNDNDDAGIRRRDAGATAQKSSSLNVSQRTM